ncbi:ABC transporter permease [Patescibacteria group bacterium]|nr:ABC transporter permease [Patescibacteria group bacterium]
MSQQRKKALVRGLSEHLFSTWVMFSLFLFVVFVVLLILGDIAYVDKESFYEALRSPEIRFAVKLSMITSIITTLIGMLIAIPTAYALSRYRFFGHTLVDSIVDIPIVFPPLIIGLSLLIFFHAGPGLWLENHGIKFVYQPAGIVLCQFLCAVPFGIRAVNTTFNQINPRVEHVALTLGCTQWGAFFRIALPMARNGIIAGTILTWARAFGIFGPLMVLVGAVRMRTEVLPTTIYLEQSIGRIEVALAVAVIMIIMATVALFTIRLLGLRYEF